MNVDWTCCQNTDNFWHDRCWMPEACIRTSGQLLGPVLSWNWASSDRDVSTTACYHRRRAFAPCLDSPVDKRHKYVTVKDEHKHRCCEPRVSCIAMFSTLCVSDLLNLHISLGIQDWSSIARSR